MRVALRAQSILILLSLLQGPSASADQGWSVARRREGVTVELRDLPGMRTPEARGTARLPYGLPLLRTVLTELDGYGRRWPYVGHARVLSKKPSSALVYCKTALPFPLSDRDFTMTMRWKDSQGRFRLDWESAAPGVGLPPQKRVIRLLQNSGYWELVELAPSLTLVTHYRRGDFGGSLTRGMRRAAVTEEPVSMIRSLRLSARGWR